MRGHGKDVFCWLFNNITVTGTAGRVELLQVSLLVCLCVEEVNILLKPVPLVQLTSSSHTTSNERYFWMKMIHSYYAVRQGLARTVYMHTRCGYHTEYPKSPLVM